MQEGKKKLSKDKGVLLMREHIAEKCCVVRIGPAAHQKCLVHISVTIITYDIPLYGEKKK